MLPLLQALGERIDRQDPAGRLLFVVGQRLHARMATSPRSGRSSLGLPENITRWPRAKLLAHERLVEPDAAEVAGRRSGPARPGRSGRRRCRAARRPRPCRGRSAACPLPAGGPRAGRSGPGSAGEEEEDVAGGGGPAAPAARRCGPTPLRNCTGVASCWAGDFSGGFMVVDSAG